MRRIHKIRTDLLLPGTHDYWEIQYLSEYGNWIAVRHTGKKTRHGGRILMEPHCTYNEAVAALTKLSQEAEQ